MGHIRLGRLPKTRPWQGLFDHLQGGQADVAQIAQNTAEAAQQHFSALEGDRRINYCFWFLVRLVTAARGADFAGELELLGLRNASFTSGLGFVQPYVNQLSDRSNPRLCLTMEKQGLQKS